MNTKINESMELADAQARLRQSGWHLFHPMWLVWPLIPALLALLAPANLIQSSPVVRLFYDIISTILPFLKFHQLHSAAPGLVSLVKCVSVIVLIPATYFFIRAVERIWPDLRLVLIHTGFKPPSRIKNWLTVSFLVAATFLGNWVAARDPYLMQGFTTQSRTGLALVEFGAVGAIAALIGTAVWNDRFAAESVKRNY